MKTILIVNFLFSFLYIRVYALDVVEVNSILEGFGREKIVETIYENYSDSIDRVLVETLIAGIMDKKSQNIPINRSEILSKYGRTDYRAIFHSFYILSTSKQDSEILEALTHLYSFNKYLLTADQISLLFEDALKREDRDLVNNILRRSVLQERSAQRRRENNNDFLNNFELVSNLIEGDNITSYSQSLVMANRVEMAKNLLEKGAVNEVRKTFILGKEHIAKGEHINVANFYKDFVEKYPTSSLAPTSYREIARAYNRAGRRDLGLKWYEKLTQDYPQSSMAASSLWYLGWHWEMREELEKAAGYYKRQSEIPGLELTQKGFFRAGLCHYKLENYQQALESFTGMATSSKKLYWQGKCHEKLGDSTSATEFFKKAASYGTLDYYGVRAIPKIHEKLEIPSNINKNSIKKLPKSLENDLRFLASLNFDFFVRYTVGEASHGLSNRDLAYNLKALGLIEHSYRIARGIEADYAKKRVTPDVVYMEMIFPMGVSPVVDENPHFDLVYSIMKQESAFIERIRSPVGAAGLMQIMPATGRGVASQKSLEFTVDSLLKKNYNITLGVSILDDHTKRYNRDLIYITSAYNAGPGRANRWRPLLDKYEDDVRAETIEFRETRDYFKKVYTNMFNYNLIYRGNLLQSFILEE